MKERCPCTRDCPDRGKTCHDTCEAYLGWKSRDRAQKEALATDTGINCDIQRMHQKSIRRAQSGRGRKRG